MARIMRLLSALLRGCLHRNTSRQFTIDGDRYVVCLDCATHLPCDLL